MAHEKQPNVTSGDDWPAFDLVDWAFDLELVDWALPDLDLWPAGVCLWCGGDLQGDGPEKTQKDWTDCTLAGVLVPGWRRGPKWHKTA